MLKDLGGRKIVGGGCIARDDALHSEAFHVVMKSGKRVAHWLKGWRLLLSEEALMAYGSWRRMAHRA